MLLSMPTTSLVTVAPQPRPRITLSKRELGLALAQLAKLDDTPAHLLYTKLAGSWNGFFAGPTRNDREFTTVTLYAHEVDVFERLSIARRCRPAPNFIATYGDPENENVEVKVLSITRPPKRRTFKIAGGRTRLVRTHIRKLNQTDQENIIMARKSKNITPAADDELEGLEGLEDLDLDDDEDEAPAAKPKKESAAAKRKRLAAEAAADADDDEDEDEEDEDDEDEEDEAPAESASAKRRRLRKEKAAAAEKPASKKSSSKKSGGNRKPPPQVQLPDGKLGPNDIAELAGVTGRDVRVFLRKQNIAKHADLGRYAFSKRDAEKFAKQIKAAAK